MTTCDQARPVNRRQFLAFSGAAFGAAAVMTAGPWAPPARAAEPRRRPNVVVVLADDLGYGELGSYGQQKIQTPVLDRMAREGVRYTDAYAGGPVCAPARCSLLTGMHSGHGTVRNNPDPGRPDETLRADEVTFPLLMQSVGYTTALFGKWGFAPEDPTHDSAPNAQGIDEFFGYLTHLEAHDYFPSYLWHNDQRVSLPENDGGAQVTYGPDLFVDRTLEFIDEHRADPFMVFLSTNIPHSPQHVPDLGPYAGEPWSAGDRAHAAQITRMDTHVGRILDKLEEHGLADDTVVVFMSDNGPHEEGAPGHDPDFFDASGPLTGYKRNLLEGGIRVPVIVWAPGLIGGNAGRVESAPWGMWDVLPTMADLAGAPVPPFVDGSSIRATFDGVTQPRPSLDFVPEERPMYWWRLEPYTTPRAAAAEGGRVQQAAEAVRRGDWKALRYAPGRDRSVPDSSWTMELYNLADDVAETTDLAGSHPELADEFLALMKANWSDPDAPRPPWSISGVAVSGPSLIGAGSSAEVTVTLMNQRDRDITDIDVDLTVPDGWSVTGSTPAPSSIPPGGSEDIVFTVRAGTDEATSALITAVAHFTVGSERIEATAETTVGVPPAPPAVTSYVSDLKWMNSSNGWGPVERDQSNGKDGAGDGPAISIAGQEYAKGLGVHAPSEVEVFCGSVGSRFTAIVGIDDFSARQNNQGSVVFQVWGDGEKLYDSGTVTAASGPVPVDVSIAGVDRLRLVVTDGGNGNAFDHSSWAEALIHVPFVEATATTRLVVGKVVVVAQATNNSEVPAELTITSDYGARTFAGVAPGRRVMAAFTTRQTAVAAGTVTVKATGTIDGSPVTASVDAEYAARTA